MRRSIVFLTAALFFIWILPLGFFIKPSQEKIACDGQRAICLCSTTQAKVKSNAVEGFGLKANSGTNKEANASGGGIAHYYLDTHLLVQNLLKSFSLKDPELFAYRNPFLKSIEHIPKV